MATNDELKARPLKRKADYDEVVTVHVREDNKKFTIHKDTLIDGSKYFRATFAHDGQGAVKDDFDLPEIESKLFHAYVNWLYKGIVTTSDGPPPMGLTIGTLCKEYEWLVDLYAVAVRLETVRLRNHIMTTMIAYLAWGARPTITAIVMAYMKTSADSPLRRFMVDTQFAANKSAQIAWFERNRLMFSEDFVLDYAHALIRALASEKVLGPLQQPKCHYHEHDEEVPTCTKEGWLREYEKVC